MRSGKKAGTGYRIRGGAASSMRLLPTVRGRGRSEGWGGLE